MTVTDLGELDLAPARTLDDLGIPSGLVQDLVLRVALIEGRTSTVRLARHLHLNPVLMTAIVEELRDLRLFEVTGLEGRDLPAHAHRRGPGAGQRAHAALPLRRRGAGDASTCTRRSSGRQHADPRIDLRHDREAFTDLVISDQLLDELGPAAMAAARCSSTARRAPASRASPSA